MQWLLYNHCSTEGLENCGEICCFITICKGGLVAWNKEHCSLGIWFCDTFSKSLIPSWQHRPIAPFSAPDGSLLVFSYLTSVSLFIPFYFRTGGRICLCSLTFGLDKGLTQDENWCLRAFLHLSLTIYPKHMEAVYSASIQHHIRMSSSQNHSNSLLAQKLKEISQTAYTRDKVRSLRSIGSLTLDTPVQFS